MKFPGAGRIIFLLFSLLFFARNGFSDDAKIPAYKGHINDFSGTLTSQEVASIEAKLKRFDDSTTTQIAVVIENGLHGSTPYDRAIAFAEGWGVGSKKNNNGVVLYIALADDDHKEDRGYFTVTSQATQGKLTDGVVGRIERRYLVPNLKAGKLYQAIDETVSAYMAALDGEFAADKNGGKTPSWLFFLIVFVIIIIISIINNSRPGRGYRSRGMYWFPLTWGGGGWGGGSGGGGWGGFGGGGGFDGGGAGGSW